MTVLKRRIGTLVATFNRKAGRRKEGFSKSWLSLVVKLLHVSVALDLGLVAVDTPFHLDIGCKGVFHTVRINVGM